MGGFERPWFVAGGWAIDLLLGRETRPHKDIEIAILRQDQLGLQRHLVGWDFRAVLPGTGGYSRPWLSEQWLDNPIHEIHASVNEAPPLEILLNEREGSDWVFRRDHRIHRALTAVGGQTPGGVPYLAPEIVLLYKAATPSPLDEADFNAALPALDEAQRLWLAAAGGLA